MAFGGFMEWMFGGLRWLFAVGLLRIFGGFARVAVGRHGVGSWWVAVDRGGLRGGFLVDSGGGLRCGGSGWVMGWLSVVVGGFGRFRW
uniref:Uncharacterized protein n=1 Tax=Fagus sylvatica TaxID=28930 RepID=A0A2N9F0E2_FAGSY